MATNVVQLKAQPAQPGSKVTVKIRGQREHCHGTVLPVADELGVMRVRWGAGWFDIPLDDIQRVTLQAV